MDALRTSLECFQMHSHKLCFNACCKSPPPCKAHAPAENADSVSFTVFNEQVGSFEGNGSCFLPSIKKRIKEQRERPRLQEP